MMIGGFLMYFFARMVVLSTAARSVEFLSGASWTAMTIRKSWFELSTAIRHVAAGAIDGVGRDPAHPATQSPGKLPFGGTMSETPRERGFCERDIVKR